MKDLAATNRAEARTCLELAIRFTELSVRLARNDEEHAHDTHELEKLRAQREPEELPTHYVRIGRGAQ